MNERIVKKQGSKFCIFSEAGKSLGCYPSRKKALKRLKQIEYFKHQKKETNVDELLIRRTTGRANPQAGRVIRFNVTNEAPDDYNTIIRAGGWDFTRYRTNPIVLWAHDRKSVPVAKVNQFIPSSATVRNRAYQGHDADVDFVDRATYPFADLLHSLYIRGFLHGSSVGFRTLERTQVEDVNRLKELGLRGPMGEILEKNELLELSLVPVPGNAGTLAKELGGYVGSTRMSNIVIAAAPTDEKRIEEWATEQLGKIRASIDGVATVSPTTLTAAAEDLARILAGKPGEEKPDEEEERMPAGMADAAMKMMKKKKKYGGGVGSNEQSHPNKPPAPVGKAGAQEVSDEDIDALLNEDDEKGEEGEEDESMEEVLDDLEEGGEVDKVAVKKAMSTALKHAESFLDALLEVKKSLGEASDDDSIEDGDEMDLEDGNEDEEEILETPEVDRK